VSATLLEKAPAKINLTLRVLGRRPDGYHEIESLVAFADFGDVLTLRTDAADGLEITGPFGGKSGPIGENLVLKAVAAGRERVAGLQAGNFLLEKNIPVAAGLGGGSADAAAALRLVARVNALALDDPRLMSAARATGADVPVCLHPQARIMRGVGERLSAPIDLPVLSALLVNPLVPLATRDVFGKFAGGRGGGDHADSVPKEFDHLIDFLERHDNDLADAACACAPVIGEILETLRALPGARLARMSGSGPTCFALFAAPSEGTAAAQKLRGERRDWWVQPAAID
jgi:4-diphosphocytidyl-2-C-methyl-D-erythritol kinase